LVQVSNIGDYRQQKTTRPPRSGLDRLLNDARLRLVETGTRNRLVHTPRGGKRTRSLPIIETDADGIFHTLVRSNRAMRFLAADRKRDLALEEPNGDFKHHPPTSDVIPTVLKTILDEEKLEKRLLAIYRDAKTAEEEQGINILFRAIGFLRWYEDDKSEVFREAPLVLAPVLLTRDLRRSTFELRCRDEDVTTNQAIQERLRTDFVEQEASLLLCTSLVSILEIVDTIPPDAAEFAAAIAPQNPVRIREARKSALRGPTSRLLMLRLLSTPRGIFLLRH
jgi:hypothetical protein